MSHKYRSQPDPSETSIFCSPDGVMYSSIIYFSMASRFLRADILIYQKTKTGKTIVGQKLSSKYGITSILRHTAHFMRISKLIKHNFQ
jgi:hypothetical protein